MSARDEPTAAELADEKRALLEHLRGLMFSEAIKAERDKLRHLVCFSCRYLIDGKKMPWNAGPGVSP